MGESSKVDDDLRDFDERVEGLTRHLAEARETVAKGGDVVFFHALAFAEKGQVELGAEKGKYRCATGRIVKSKAPLIMGCVMSLDTSMKDVRVAIMREAAASRGIEPNSFDAMLVAAEALDAMLVEPITQDNEN